ncbi:putative methyltransferase YdaC [Styela clava]
MVSRIAQKLALNAKQPQNGFWGSLVGAAFLRNGNLEKTCFELLESLPEHKVLCVGFNRAIGLEFALSKQQYPGKVFGIDHSELMCKLACEKLRHHIDNDELTILCESVHEMSIPDNSIDRIFHTNCHVFWDDIDKSCEELYRVLKPGGKMVSLARYNRLRLQQKFGLLNSSPITSGFYIGSLIAMGFDDIRVKNVKVMNKFSKACAVYASKPILTAEKKQFFNFK